jgi:hypothetical protein
MLARQCEKFEQKYLRIDKIHVFDNFREGVMNSNVE